MRQHWGALLLALAGPVRLAGQSAEVTPLAPLPPLLASLTPDFVWTSGTMPGFDAPVAYRLRIARDSGFSSPLIDTVLDATAYTLRQAIKPGAPVFWRVDATSASGATATTGTVGPIGALAWARLTSLADSQGSATAETQPVFTWSPSPVASPPGPLQFDLFVRPTSDPLAALSFAGLTDTTFPLPTALDRNGTYRWGLVVHAGADTSLVLSPAAFVVLESGAPPATVLYQNFPNPFPTPTRSSACIWFDLAQPGAVTLEILNLRGGVVRQLLPQTGFPPILQAGRYGRGSAGGSFCDQRLAWDGRADDGRWLPAGVYLYKLRVGGVIQFKRIVFLGRAS